MPEIRRSAQLEIRVASDQPLAVATMLRRIASDIESGGAGGVIEDGALYAFYEIERVLSGRL